MEQDHRVASVLGSAARREPHSRHPEPLEAVVSADTRAFLEGGGVLASLANYNLVP